MGGFLSGLNQLLGGWNQVRRIDEDGFDWREKDAAAQFERDRRTQLAGQADEDRAVNIGRDVMLGAEEGEEPDLSSLLPGYDQGLTKARIRGAVAQSKPALQQQQSYARLAQEQARQEGRIKEIGLRGDETQELENLRERNRSRRDLNPGEVRKLQYLEQKDAADRKNDLERSRLGGGRPLTADEYDPATGMTRRRFYTPEQARAMAESGQGVERIGASEQNRRAASRASIESGNRLLTNLKKPAFVKEVGPLLGRYNSLSAAAGAGDPYAQYLVGEIRGFSALQPQIHGFRAVDFVRDIERLLSTKQTPESLAAGLEGIMTVSHIVAGQDVPTPGFMQQDQEREGLESLAQELAGLSPEERAQILGGGPR